MKFPGPTRQFCQFSCWFRHGRSTATSGHSRVGGNVGPSRIAVSRAWLRVRHLATNTLAPYVVIEHQYYPPTQLGSCPDGFSMRCGPALYDLSAGMGRQTMRNVVRSELREFVWLATMVSGISILSVGLAVALAMVLPH